MARLGHRHDRLPGRVRARGEPARRAERGFKLIMANFQWERLAMALGAVGAMRSPGSAPRAVRARAHRVRAPAVRPPGDPPPARRPRRLRRTPPLRHLRRAAPVRRRRGTAARGHDGQAPDPARMLRADGRLPADPRRRRLHARGTGSSAPCATRGWVRSAAAPTRSCARSSGGCWRRRSAAVGRPYGAARGCKQTSNPIGNARIARSTPADSVASASFSAQHPARRRHARSSAPPVRRRGPSAPRPQLRSTQHTVRAITPARTPSCGPPARTSA